MQVDHCDQVPLQFTTQQSETMQGVLMHVVELGSVTPGHVPVKVAQVGGGAQELVLQDSVCVSPAAAGHWLPLLDSWVVMLYV